VKLWQCGRPSACVHCRAIGLIPTFASKPALTNTNDHQTFCLPSDMPCKNGSSSHFTGLGPRYCAPPREHIVILYRRSLNDAAPISDRPNSCPTARRRADKGSPRRFVAARASPTNHDAAPGCAIRKIPGCGPTLKFAMHRTPSSRRAQFHLSYALLDCPCGTMCFPRPLLPRGRPSGHRPSCPFAPVGFSTAAALQYAVTARHKSPQRAKVQSASAKRASD